MAADIPNKHKEKIEIVYAFDKGSIDNSYMAGEHLEPIDFFNPSIFNLFIRAITPTHYDKSSSHQHGFVASGADVSN